jgi:hypothetical protein
MEDTMNSVARCGRLRATLLASLICVAATFSPNATYAQTPLDQEADLIVARIHDAEKLLRDDARNEKLSPEQLRKTAEFLAGTLSFAMLDEVGRALIADLGLPVLGAREDAADTYAILGMLTLGAVAGQGALESAAKGWFYGDRNDRDHGAAFGYYDTHGLHVQRAYRIVCLMVGSDPDKFKSLADDTKLPEDRQDSCAADYADAKWSWVKALTPYYRKTPDLPRTTISVAYGDAKGNLDIYRRFVAATQMTEVTAGHLADAFLWPAPFTIEWQTCGEAGARWQSQSRKLLVCYELADDFARLYRDYGNVEIPKPDHLPALN